jgi:hypothetical protein
MPQYVISQAPGKVVLRNFEGFITTYDEPMGGDYTGHTVARPEQPVINLEAGQEGVAGILAGLANQIKPEGFDCTHQRAVTDETSWTSDNGLPVDGTWQSFDTDPVRIPRASASVDCHKPGRR